MLHPRHAEMLLERQLAATDWIEAAPPPNCDLAAVQDYRRKLQAIRQSEAWDELLRLQTPKFDK